MRRLHAIVLLGWHFLLHYLSKITFLYDPGGLEQFRENFDSEGIRSLDDQERRALAEWQNCIGCGLCEAECSELDVIPEHSDRGPSFLAETALRDLSNTEFAADDAEALADADFDRLEDACPTDVPIGDLVTFLAESKQNE